MTKLSPWQLILVCSGPVNEQCLGSDAQQPDSSIAAGSTSNLTPKVVSPQNKSNWHKQQMQKKAHHHEVGL
jgi:hypothetical protein